MASSPIDGASDTESKPASANRNHLDDLLANDLIRRLLANRLLNTLSWRASSRRYNYPSDSAMNPMDELSRKRSGFVPMRGR